MAAAALLFVHATVTRDYLVMVGQLGLRGAPAAGTPLQQPYPAFATDAQTWVRHALSLLEGDNMRLRRTDIDNFPDGREIHWNSAWAWTIAAAGWCHYHLMTGLSLPEAVERSAVWLNAAVLSVFVIVFSWWAARRAGVVAGAALAIAMVGHRRMFEGFSPGYVDHHGLIAVAVLGLVLGASLMGAGWWQMRDLNASQVPPGSTRAARRAAIVSAISGAFGLWISAASLIPAIAIVGCAGVVVILLRGRKAREAGVEFDPETWRTWGRTGALGSVLFFLLEYFPAHMGFRLEANHPVYALAWWGGGELIALAGEGWLRLNDGRPHKRSRGVAAMAAISVAPITIAVGGATVFRPLDPFLANLHRQYIREFLPLWKNLSGSDPNAMFSVIVTENVPLLAALVFLGAAGRTKSVTVWFSTAATLAFTTFAWMQARWLLIAAGAQLSLAIVLLAMFTGKRPSVLRATVATGFVVLLFAPAALDRITERLRDVRGRRVTSTDVQSVLYRDIAAAIRASTAGEVVLLAGPNSSTAIGYYGRFKTVGTLYWENLDGLKTAARILAARTPEEAALLIGRHGVTHIAMISDDDFVAEYCRLLEPDADDADVSRRFGSILLAGTMLPSWLESLAYVSPDELRPVGFQASLFKVAGAATRETCGNAKPLHSRPPMESFLGTRKIFLAILRRIAALSVPNPAKSDSM